MRHELRRSNRILWARSTGRFLYSAYGIRASLAALGNVTFYVPEGGAAAGRRRHSVLGAAGVVTPLGTAR